MNGNFIGISGSCGKPDNPKRRANFALDANLVWDPNWTLRLQNGSASVSPVDRCKVTIANFDVTDKAIGVMNRVAEGIPAKADEHLRGVTTLREGGTKAWNALQQPIIVNQQLWIDLRPERVVVTPLNGSSESVRATLGLYAHPRVVLGNAPAPSPSTPLPTLQVGTPESDFHIAPRVLLSFKALNDLLSSKLVGQVFKLSIPLWPDLKVKITGTHVAGSNDYVAIGLDLSGSVRGTAWVVGKITYDPTNRIALIQYVDYDIQTHNVLIKAARWLVPKLLDDAVRKVAKDFKYDVGKEADDIKSRLTEALNRPIGNDATIRTDIGQILISSPFTQDSSFAFMTDMRGRSQLELRPFGQPIPTGKEIRFISVYFETFRDDKDAEEPLDLWIYQDGNPNAIAHREIGRDERWGDSPPENQGPYFLRIPNLNISDCSTLTLRIRKQPAGSATGKGWWNRMTARIYRADGSEVVAARSGDDQWGDGNDHPYDRRFRLVCP
jgi:hypothetical protein